METTRYVQQLDSEICLVCLCTVGMIDLFIEICGSAPFARAHGQRNDRRLFEMSLSICTEGQALVIERTEEKQSLFCFLQKVQ
jgi:hypothetical protein